MGQVALTVEQLRAGLATDARINIEAAPGSGKTTVAAERYGMYRYATGLDSRGVLALSFTRSAREVLARRIRTRWGSASLDRPNLALTFDSLHFALLELLLHGGHVNWPHSGEVVTVLDSWRGVSGCRRLTVGDSRWVARLSPGGVVARGAAPVETRGDWMSVAAVLTEQLGRGTCTHEDIRSVVHGALARPALRAALRAALADRFRAVVVDEVYDANGSDLELLELLCEAGLPVALIGDHWQALYGFRGARPDLVPALLGKHGFVEHEVSRSFRFESAELEERMAQLREGKPLVLEPGSVGECDVALATGWGTLWSAEDDVLPISVGEVSNQSAALLTVLLNRVTTTRLGIGARNHTEACFLLGIAEQDESRSAVLDTFLSRLVDPYQPLVFEDLRACHNCSGWRASPRSWGWSRRRS